MGLRRLEDRTRGLSRDTPARQLESAPEGAAAMDEDAARLIAAAHEKGIPGLPLKFGEPYTVHGEYGNSGNYDDLGVTYPASEIISGAMIRAGRARAISDDQIKRRIEYRVATPSTTAIEHTVLSAIEIGRG